VANSDLYSQLEVFHQVKSILCVFYPRNLLCAPITQAIIRLCAVATAGIFEKTKIF
jgi:hypothetical protein